MRGLTPDERRVLLIMRDIPEEIPEPEWMTPIIDQLIERRCLHQYLRDGDVRLADITDLGRLALRADEATLTNRVTV